MAGIRCGADDGARAIPRNLTRPGGRLPSPIFVLFTKFLGSGLTMALGRWLDAAEADDDGEATAARPLVTVPIERRELGGRRAQHPVRRRPPH